MLADLPGCHGHAGGLRTGAPVAKPRIPCLSVRKLEALVANLQRCTVEDFSLCRGRSQQSA